jgi:hypothetical protein
LRLILAIDPDFAGKNHQDFIMKKDRSF